ncbi:MAG: SDR family oxidoreductase [Candidatus Brachytrichaceae bacterium NZ_4S206]|jgi:nucleoside-diphosphate-sugar epimerase
MKVLFIGGTGIISSACAQLCIERGHELFILTRGQSHKYDAPASAFPLRGDIRKDPDGVGQLIAEHHFDAVVDWVAFTPDHIEQDIRLFTGRTRQFVFISSASAYQKPPAHYRITEDTPLANPHWQYSRDKIACEELLMREFRERGFPVTIVRPSLTYGPSNIPLVLGSWQHPWTMMDRMLRGLPVIVPGDGTSLWTVTWNGDFAKGLVGLLGREQLAGHAFHITSDETLTWDQIYREAAHAVGVEPKIVHIASDWIVARRPEFEGTLLGDKAHSVVFDNSKIKRFVPDFVCSMPWAEGVRRSIAWFMADPARRTVDEAHNQVLDELIRAYLGS